MPNWRFHLFTGSLLAVFLIYTSYYLGFWYLFVDQNRIQYLFWLHVIFIILLGSLIPDFDKSKTKIRHSLWLILGLFLVISILYLYYEKMSLNEMLFLFSIPFALLIILFLFGSLIPFRHRGILHSLFGAGLYSLIWMIFEYLIFKMTISEVLLLGAFGFIGYISHLILDRDLKLI